MRNTALVVLSFVAALMAITPWSAQATILTFSQNPDPFRAQENSGVQTSFLNVQTDAFVKSRSIFLRARSIRRTMPCFRRFSA